MPKREEWAWVAGIIEGEGHIGLGRNPARKGDTHSYSSRLKVAMADAGVVERLVEYTGVGTLGWEDRSHLEGFNLALRVWRVSNRKDVIYVLTNVMPWLGERKLDAADRLMGLAYAWPLHCKDREGYARAS